MVETEASRSRRKGKEIPLTETEELQLTRTKSHSSDLARPMAVLSKV